jgi:hypothetical protein
VMFAVEWEVSYTRLMSADAQLAHAGSELGDKGRAIGSFFTNAELVKLMEQGVFLVNHVKGWTARPVKDRKPVVLVQTYSDVTPPGNAPRMIREGGPSVVVAGRPVVAPAGRALAFVNAWGQAPGPRLERLPELGGSFPDSFEEEGPAPAPAGPPVPRPRVVAAAAEGLVPPPLPGAVAGSLMLGNPLEGTAEGDPATDQLEGLNTAPAWLPRRCW